MIAAFSQNEVSAQSTKNSKYLDKKVTAIASSKHPRTSEGVTKGLSQLTSQLAQTFDRAARAVVEQAFTVGRTLSQAKKNLKRSEYQIFLAQPGWTVIKANKYLKLVKTFDGFSLDQLGRLSLDTLFTLCSSRYQKLVVKLRELPELTQTLVEQLMKECRLARARKPQESVTGWKRNQSGGGRHYQILLHDEETGIKIEQIAQAQQVLPQRVIKEAIALYTPLQDNPDLTLSVLQNWEEFAEQVGRNRNRLLKLVKEWVPEQRQKLTELLATHLRSNPDALREVAGWVSGNLLKAALSQLSFVIKKMGDPDELTDDPGIDYIHCRFVSVEYPGTKNEQWIFADVNNRLFPIFSRHEFAIEASAIT